MNTNEPSDWQKYNHPDIRKQAGRLATLVRDSRTQKSERLLSVLDFLLGALHELARADFYQFKIIPNRKPEIAPIVKRATAFEMGGWRRNGQWMAGLHFNSGLMRISAVHHRSLQLVLGEAADDDDRLYELRRKACRFYRKHRGKDWSYSNIAIVHKEVNKLKHVQVGTWPGRTAPFATTMRAVRETIDLLEVWNDTR